MSKRIESDLSTNAEKEKAKLVDELVIVREDKAKRAAEFVATNNELELATEKAKLIAELIILNKELACQIEKQIQSDQALQVSNEKYLKAFQSSPCSITISRLDDGGYIEVNDTFVSMSGFTRKEALSNATIGLNIWEDKEERKSVTSALLSGKDVEGKEFQFWKKNGEIMTGLFSAKIMYINKEPYMISSVDDITERKNAERALVESKKIAERYLNVAADLIMSLDTLGNITLINDSGCKLLGYKKDELIGKNWFRTCLSQEISSKLIVFEKLMNGNILNAETYENPVKTKSGELKTMLWHNALLKDLNGKISGTISSGIDITERKQTEKLLKESEQKSMSIMENSADAIFIANQQGKYVYTNKAVSVMLGYTAEEMISKTIADITSSDITVETSELFKQILNEGKGFAEIELIMKDGNYISTDLNAVVLPDGTIYGSCRDITERKKAELELIRAKEKAEESDRLKSAFLTNMSHEIRTPMNGILGFAELLKRPNLTDEQQQEFIGIIGESGNRMLNTINSIMDISKIEAGLISIKISESNINTQIEFLYNFFTPMTESKGLQLSFNNGLTSKEAIIKTDIGKFNSILTYLVGNAIKFTDEGSIEFGYEKSGEYLEFFVKDTGIGIPQDRLEAIFERFVQADIEDKRVFEGSGLGLTISKSYVGMLGGKIWVESEEGKGTKFYFTIPYILESDTEPKIKDLVSPKPKDVQIISLQILIVEDDEISYLWLSEALQESKHEVFHASTGVEAIEACRNYPQIDLVLMDIRMPEMDGYEATRQIRLFNTDVIIIAQSAYAFAVDMEKATEAGCNDYISKPIKMTLLLDKIKKHCNN
jgi:hypothetical protein